MQGKLTRSKALRRVLILAVPSILENIMITLVSMVDTAMVGSLGKEATAAVAINASPSWLINSISMAISVGATVMIARCWGGEDYEGAGRYVRQSLVLSLLLGVTLTIGTFLLAPFIPIWMGAEAAIHAEAMAYMRIISLGFIPNYLGVILFGALRGSGDTRTPMVITIAVNLINVVGNFLLIYPSRTILGGLPMWGAGLGVQGAAISTAFSTALSGIIMLLLLARRKDALRLTAKSSYRLHKREVLNILRIGLPAAAERVAINLGNILYTSIVSSLGTAALSAHHLAITAEGICYNPVFGFSVAATTMVGQSLGAGKEKDAAYYGRINILLGIGVMTVLGALMFLFAPWMIGLFTPDPEVVELGAMALRIIAFAEPFFGMAIVASGALRGAGDTIVPLWIGIAGMWGVRVALAIVLVRWMDLGLVGAWIAMAVDLALRGSLTLIRFLSGGWKKRARRMTV